MMMTGETSSNADEVAKVRVDKLLPHLTCSICNELYTECTTIAECLHKFCKQCIFDKFTIEYQSRCPVCNLYLGANPLTKLRKDNNVDNLRVNLFPKFESKKPAMVDNNPPKDVQFKRKENMKSLSFLVDNLPKAPTHDKTTKKRSSKSRSRKTTPVKLLIVNGPSPKVDYKQSTSSNASSSKSVLPKNAQTNEKDNEQQVMPRMLCDLNMMPDIMEEEDDEQPSRESTPSIVSSDTSMPMPYLLKKNDNFEFKPKDNEALFDDGTKTMPPSKNSINLVLKAKGGSDKVSTKEISFDKSSKTTKQLEKKKGKKAMEEVLPRKFDLNTLLTRDSIVESSSTNPPKIMNNASHLDKNKNYSTTKGKEIVVYDDNHHDDDNNDNNNCSSFGWFNKEQPNFQLNKNNTNVTSNESKRRGRRMKKTAQAQEEDDQLPLGKLSSKKTPRRRQRKLKNNAQPSKPQLEVTPPPSDEEKETVVGKRPQDLAMMNPIWFTLLASNDPEAGELLPQVSYKHLRVKDINMPVSYVMKYIAQKLDIDDYNEVELLLRGHRVMPSLRLCSLREVWCQNAKTLPEASEVRYKESAEKFMMVLTYALKSSCP